MAEQAQLEPAANILAQPINSWLLDAD